MSRRSQTYRVMPWVGGVNTSVDSGVLNSQELVRADNVQFSASGARIKREALEYLEDGVPAPDYKSSSGTTRTLKWTSHPLVNIGSPNERLVVGETIKVIGDTDYLATASPVLSRSVNVQVSTVLCVPDVSGSLASKYFLISAGDGGSDYYVWFKVSGTGTDPNLPTKIGVEVDISTNASAATVASAVQVAVDALTDFAASVGTATVTITNAVGGYTVQPSGGNAGFTVGVTTIGGHSITYAGTTSLSQASTATSAITVTRASAVINYTDYWYFDTDSHDNQIGIVVNSSGQVFTLDDSGRRVQIHAQEQIEQITCIQASSMTTGHYFLLDAADGTGFYVWYNKAAGGGDPGIIGRTAVPVAIGGADTAAQVATATAAAIDALAQFTSTALSTAVTVTNVTAGLVDSIVEGNSGHAFSVVSYGATIPASALTARTLIFNEDCNIFFSAIGDKPIAYNPNRSAKYQLIDVNCPDASFAIAHLGRIWCNDKTNKGRLHYCETFDQTLWLGLGDSGAIDIFPGDGDPEGINNAYPYKGFLMVGKKAKRYRILGDAPENFQVEIVSEGLGNESMLAIPVDETDVVFMSRRGLHSQQVTDQYGDTDAAYLSSDIKPTFNSWETTKLKYSQGVYIPELNSFALSVAEDGQTSQNAIWLYNIEVQVPNKQRPGAWYRWPDISCTALSRRYINSKYRMVIGTVDGRLMQAQRANDYADFQTTGIPYSIKSGTIYPNDDAQRVKAFKKISMIYRPQGNFSFIVRATIDNQRAQSFNFNQISGLDLLGETFVLGTSLLGSSATLAPFTFTMEGIGRGVTLEITQASADEQVEIWGFIIEFEDADLTQSTDNQ